MAFFTDDAYVECIECKARSHVFLKIIVQSPHGTGGHKMLGKKEWNVGGSLRNGGLKNK